jgi:hypothetical protein
MEIFSKSLKEKRPQLSMGSLKTYYYTLKSLYTKITGSKTMDDYSLFNETNVILNELHSTPPPKRKTILSALYVLTEKPIYREEMMKDCITYSQNIANQDKTEKITENWVEKEDLEKKAKELKKNTQFILRKKEISTTEKQEIQNYLLLVLCGGLYFAPRRSLDWTDMKIHGEIDKEKDNYIEKKGSKMFFIFNSYKTAGTYGKQTVEIPNEVKKILKMWFPFISPDCDTLLFDTHNKPLSAVKLNQRLNAIFGKKVGTSQLRKTYLTSKYGHTIQTQQELNDDVRSMGTSLNVMNHYILK